jgi:hypothetical protein
MTFRLDPVCAAIVGILEFSQQPAFAASSLIGTIAEIFRYPAVMPLPIFENLKPAILRGSPIFGMPGRSEPGTEVVDAGRIRTCAIPAPTPPFRRSTEGFLKRFVATENIDELRLLFGLGEQDALSIDTYEVRLRNVFFFHGAIRRHREEFRLGNKRQILRRRTAGSAADGRSDHCCRSLRGVPRPAPFSGKHRRQVARGRGAKFIIFRRSDELEVLAASPPRSDQRKVETPATGL